MKIKDIDVAQKLYKKAICLKRRMRVAIDGEDFISARDELESMDFVSEYLFETTQSKIKTRDLKKSLVDEITRMSNGFVVLNEKQAERIINFIFDI